MTGFEFLADLAMLAHAVFSVFVVLGFVLIAVGTVLGWQWTARKWFPRIHLAATLFVVVRSWVGLPCPFSAGEDNLRYHTAAICPLGNRVHEALHRLAFRGKDPHRFAQSTVLFGSLVLATFVLNHRHRRGLCLLQQEAFSLDGSRERVKIY